MLKKIRLGLEGGKATTCALTVGSGEGRPALELSISVELPGGLAPLDWTIRLAVTGDGTMKDRLVVPLLRAQHRQHKELSGLRELIKDKDHVIQKLLDKLESIGTDLGQVFAQAAGRPGRKGDWHKDRVKGMATFDYEKWREDLSQDQPQDIMELLKESFTGPEDGARYSRSVVDGTASGDEESWWQSIVGLTINLSSGKVSTSKGFKKGQSFPKQTPIEALSSPLPSPRKTTPEIPRQASALEEAFEPLPSPQKADNETDDDNNLDAVLQASRKPSSPLPVPKTRRVIGQIGGKKKVASPTPDAQRQDQREPERPKSSADTISDELTAPATINKPTARPKKKLGQIGGKKRKSTTPPPDVTTRNGGDAAIAGTPKKSTGVQEEKRHAPNAKEEEESARGRPSVKAERSATPPPRETSDERADRKREQLKKELAQRAKAPAKKKRKL